MKKRIIRTVFASAALIAASVSYAQEPVYTDSVPDNIDNELLDEVVVTASKPLVQTKADKVIYNMDEDASAQTATVLDALRKVPMVSVDADGNIKLKGEGNFKIYMNGKPDPSLSSNYKDLLKAMPASMIKKVEVITDPGAKYDAEGVGGIINIVTESQSKLEGYSATFSFTGGSRMLNGGVNAMAKLGKVSMNLTYNHAYNMSQGGVTQESSQYYFTDPVNYQYRMKSKIDVNNNFDFGGLQAAWEPNASNLFTVNANLFNVSVPFNTTIDYEMLSKTGERQWSYKSKTDMDVRYLNYTVGANWQHNFRSPDHNLVFLYQYNRNSRRDDRTYIYYDYDNYNGIVPDIRTEVKYPDNEHTFQVDYTYPFLKNHILETGAKYIMRRNYGDTRESTSPDGINWEYDAANSVEMTQHQDVAAVYAAYTGKFANFMVKGGVRYEHAHLSSKFHTPGHENFSQDLNDVVPNLLLSYTMPDYSSVSLSYQMRITRPGLEELNPYRKQESPLSITYGNPELISQKANNLNLTYSNFTLPVQMNITLGYSYTDKMILTYQYLGADDVSYTTYGNFGHCNNGSLFAYLAYPITNSMRVSLNGGVNYADYKSGKVGVHNHGWGWNAGANYTYQMPWKLELNLYGGAGNGGVGFQDKSSVWSYHGLGISKSMLKEDRLRISLSANNFCTPVQKYTRTIDTPEMRTVSMSKYNSWNVAVSVSYRIGSFNSRIKTTSKTIVNDDVNQNTSTPGSTPDTRR